MTYFEARAALQALQQRCRDEFKRLRTARGGSMVWLLEHGLDADELADLRDALLVLTSHQDAAEVVEREGVWLCLLILCVEVGYAYEGTGTDYWPRVAEELGRPVLYAEREGIRDLFERKAGPLTGVRPPDTPWSRNFSIITWPITHAVLPAELRRPLLHAIWACPVPIDSETDAPEVVGPLRRWASRQSDRLLTLLEQEQLAAGVVKHMLGREVAEPVLRGEVLDRLTADLREDRAALRELLKVRQRQATLRRRPPARVRRRTSSRPETIQAPPRIAKLLLQVEPTLGLYVRCPKLPELLGGRAQEIMRRHRRGHVRLWGATRPLPVLNVLKGLDVPIRINRLPVSTTPVQLLPELPRALDDEQLRLVLQAIQTQLELPLVFAAHAGPPGFALQMNDASVFGGGTWWVLVSATPPGPLPPGVGQHPDQRTAGVSAYRVDPSSPAARDWLQQVGVKTVPNATVDLIGPPCWGRPMDYEEGGLSTDDHLFVRATGLTDQELLCAVDGAAAVSIGRLFRLPTACSEIAFKMGSLEQGVQVRRQGQETEPVVRCSLEGPVLRLEALLAGELGVHVDGDLPFEGLTARLSLRAGEQDVTVYSDLSALPVRIGPGAQVWKDLAQLARSKGMDRSPRAQLRLHVGAVAYESWLLEGGAGRVWWDESQPGLRAIGETAAFKHVLLPGEEPLWSARVLDGGGAGLRIPMDEGGDAVLGCGLVTTAGSLVLGQSQPRRPERLRRTVSGAAGDSLDVATSWLAWATARGADLLADGVRGRVATEIEAWLVQALCGGSWRRLECKLVQGTSSLTESLIGELRSRRLVYDDYADPPLQAAIGEGRLDQLAVAVLTAAVRDEPRLASSLEALPEYWSSGASMVDEALRFEMERPIEGLEAVVNNAYERLLLAVEVEVGAQVSGYEEPDIVLDPADVWAAVVAVSRRRRELEELHVMLERLFPATARPALAALDYEVDDDHLIEVLADWEKTHASALASAGPGRVSPWGRDGLRALYDLWQRPRRAVATGVWRQELPRFLGGRATCRVVRYAVLRRRAALAGWGT